MEYNRDLEKDRHDIETQEASFDEAWYQFDPKLSGSYHLSNSRVRPESASTELSISRSNFFTISLSKEFPTGDTFGIAQNITRSSGSSGTSISPASYSGNLAFTYSRPLFRKASKAINLAGIEQARNDVTLATLQYKLDVVGVKGAVTQAYWDVVSKAKILIVREADLSRLNDLSDKIQQRGDKGKAVETDELQAKSALDAQRASCDQAQVDLDNSKDALKLIIGLDTTGTVVVPDFDTILPVQRPPSSSILVQEAQDNDAELQKLLTQRQNADLSRLVLKNELRPDVNLTAEYSKNGVDPNNPDVLSDMHSPRVNIDVTYTLDFGQRKAKRELATQDLSIDDLDWQIAARKEQVQTTLETTVRQLQQSIDTTVPDRTTSRDSAKASFDATMERFLERHATTLDVIQAEQNLLQAELDLVAAQISQLTLRSQLDTLLGRDTSSVAGAVTLSAAASRASRSR